MRISERLRIPIVSGLAAVACGRGSAVGVPSAQWARLSPSCSESAPATSLPKARFDSLPIDVDSVGQDGRWAKVAPQITGGWGGGLFLEDGFPTIYLTDPGRNPDALAALNRLGVDGHAWGVDVHVRRGRWNFTQLYSWYRYINYHMGSIALSGTDIDEARNRLQYWVTTDAAKRNLEAQLSAMGVPCFLVSIDIRPLATPAAPAG